MNIKKHGFQIPISLEMLTQPDPAAPQRRGHWEKVTPTVEQITQRKRALAALKEMESNPFVEWPRMDEDITIADLTRKKWVAEESFEEYRERLQAWYQGER